MKELVCCVDVGTTRIKAAAFGPNASPAVEVAVDTPAVFDWEGFVALDAEDCFSQVCLALRDVTGRLPAGAKVQALALTNQRATVLLAGDDGRPACPALSWQDTSGETHLNELVEAFGNDRYSRTTGLPPSALWSLAKLLRLKAGHPGLCRDTAAVLLHDFILRRLGAEEFVTDPSNASVTGLLDVTSRRWSESLLEAAGWPEERLPKLVPAGEVCGVLSPGAADATGLPAGLPLVVGGGDQQCSALGLGALEEGDAGLCLGTAAILSCPVREPQPGLVGSFFCTCHVLPSYWVLEGIDNAFISCLEWVGNALHLSSTGERLAAAERSPPGANGVMFLPFLAGIGSPDFDAAAAGTFLGLRLTHTPADLMRATYEGIALEVRRMLEAVERQVAVRRLLVAGGFMHGAAGGLLADILGRPIATCEVAETSLRGAAVLAWSAAEAGSDTRGMASRASVAGGSLRQPAQTELYLELFERYKESVELVRRVYRRGRSRLSAHGTETP